MNNKISFCIICAVLKLFLRRKTCLIKLRIPKTLKQVTRSLKDFCTGWHNVLKYIIFSTLVVISRLIWHANKIQSTKIRYLYQCQFCLSDCLNFFAFVDIVILILHYICQFHNMQSGYAITYVLVNLLKNLFIIGIRFKIELSSKLSLQKST